MITRPYRQPGTRVRSRSSRCRMGGGHERAGLAGLSRAENVGDWVVLHGGATAVFLVSSLGDAARLADAVAQVPGIEGGGVLITVADDQLTVRLTRGMEQLEPRHVELARAVSTIALQHVCAWPDGAAGLLGTHCTADPVLSRARAG